jgi:ferredoxin/flavodoxin---NADP+ reductase
MPDELNAILVQRTEVAPGLAILRVAPTGWQLPPFQPGQFGVLGLPGAAPRAALCDPDHEPTPPERLIRRAYSIASSSLDREYLEFYVALVPSGALTPRLWALPVGHRLWLSPKLTGMFTLDQVPADKHLVMISTGTGLAPYMSMLRTQLAPAGPRRFAVLHGARHSGDLGYRSELMSLARVCRHLTYLPSISRPDEEPIPWHGLVGHIQDVWASRPLQAPWGFNPAPDNAHVFLCGNPVMIESMVGILEGEGFREHKPKAPGTIHLERYW